MNRIVLIGVAALVLALGLLRCSAGGERGPRPGDDGLPPTVERVPDAHAVPEGEPAPLEVSRSNPIDPVDPDPQAPASPGAIPTGAETEDRNLVNWRVLRYSLNDYRNKPIKDARGSREGSLICRAVATMLALSGRDRDPDMSFSPPDGSHYIVSNGRGYSWARGEFPEYDAWKDYIFAMARYEEAVRDGKADGLSAPEFDPQYFELIDQRAVEAIAALEAKYGFNPEQDAE